MSDLESDQTLTNQPAPTPTGDRLFNALLTEHFVLQTARGITVAESSSRASLYFVTLSSALVAYGFLAGSQHETAFLAVVLPVVFVLGIASYARLVETSLEDVLALAGIQRIRGYYARLSEEAPRYFPLPAGAAAPNELLDTGRHAGWWGVFYTMSTSVGVVNAVVAGAALFVLLSAGGTTDGVAIPAALALAVLVALAEAAYQEARYRAVTRSIASHR